MRVFLVCGNSNCDILVLLLPLHTLWSKASSAFSPHFASLCTDLLLLRQRLGDNTGFLIISHSPWHLFYFLNWAENQLIKYADSIMVLNYNFSWSCWTAEKCNTFFVYLNSSMWCLLLVSVLHLLFRVSQRPVIVTRESEHTCQRTALTIT